MAAAASSSPSTPSSDQGLAKTGREGLLAVDGRQAGKHAWSRLLPQHTCLHHVLDTRACPSFPAAAAADQADKNKSDLHWGEYRCPFNECPSKGEFKEGDNDVVMVRGA